MVVGNGEYFLSGSGWWWVLFGWGRVVARFIVAHFTIAFKTCF